MQVRAGTGGDEAALFASDLFRMYQRFAEAQRWRFEVRAMRATQRPGATPAVGNLHDWDSGEAQGGCFEACGLPKSVRGPPP